MYLVARLPFSYETPIKLPLNLVKLVLRIGKSHGTRVPLAAVVGLYPDYLRKRFKQEVGIGFDDFLLTRRLQRAMALLDLDEKHQGDQLRGGIPFAGGLL